jgi:PleD family two-component response regulator
LTTKGINTRGLSPCVYLTVSMGMASVILGSRYSQTFLVEEADAALYLAKKSGRNIVKGIRI